MLKVGITGGIGSGKTTICRIFETLGIPVYYADERAKWLMLHDEALVDGVKQLFGEEAYTKEGLLNRPFIAQIVFNDQAKLNQLNQLVHPAVHRDGQVWHDAQKDVAYTLNEAALMVESGGYHKMDQLITVFAPKEIRINRVMARDQVERAAVEARISKQLPEEEKLKVAHHIIYNDGEHSLIQQVHQIHQVLVERKKLIEEIASS